ncbi:glycosyltransferase [uncultured Psychroserpens sp.]|uniref:glycosyltransferase family 2 protein n=1 Tax=uncultured Psychroserpens sp. TaxID=255436 RepID=UPI00260F0754|nr:glycosyltransferase [uncultured Psychroserpens sp.]
MSAPLVSIIIPTYNRPHFIGIALDSIIAQSYTNWECIVVNDTDDQATTEVMEAYCGKDSRVQYHKRPSHVPKGVNGSRNFGLSKCKGEFVAFCDDDDFWLKDKLEKQIEIFKKHPEVGLVTGNFEYVNTDGKRTGRIITHKGNHGYVFENLIFKNRTSAITPMIKKEVIDKVGEFNTNFTIFEDWEYWRRIAYYYPFYGMKEVLACVRLHDDNTSKIVTTQPLEQYIRYRKLNKATLAWGSSRFTKKQQYTINKIEWQRINQILTNHCPGLKCKLRFVFDVLVYSPKEFGRLIYLFLKY